MALKPINIKKLSSQISRDLDTLLELEKPAHVANYYVNKKKVDRAQLPSTDDLIRIIRIHIVKRTVSSIRTVVNDEKLLLEVSTYKKAIIRIESSSKILILNSSGRGKYNELIEGEIKKHKIKNRIIDSISSTPRSQENKNILPQEKMIDYAVEKAIEEESSIIEKGAKKKEEEIDLLIEKKEQDIYNLSSILKSVDEDKLIFEEEITPETVTDWWAEISLRGDPFNMNGLEDIDAKDYDDILIDNSGVKFAKDFRKNRGDFRLGKNNLLLGQLGTGKSCVIQYISNSSLNRDITSFTVRIASAFSVEGLHHSFYAQTILKMSRWFLAHNIKETLEPTQEGFIYGLLKILDERPQMKGFIIFIEDLHKISNTDIVFDFLQMIQPLQESMTDEGISISFIVTGIPDWERKVLDNPFLTSVFSSTDILRIEDVSPETATKAIMKRFDVYRIDRETTWKNNNRYNLSKKYILGLTSLIKRYTVHTGFRLFFSEVKNNLINKQFDMFQVNPVGLTEDMQKQYLLMYSHDDEVKRYLDRMLNRRLKDSQVNVDKQRERKIRILAHIIQNNGIKETDLMLENNNNRVILDHLFRTCKVITMDPEGLEWLPVKPVMEFNKLLLEKFDVGLEYFLVHYHMPTTTVTKFKESKEAYSEQYNSDINYILEGLKAYGVDSNTIDEFNSISNKIFDNVLVPRHVRARGHVNLDIESVKMGLNDLISFLIKFESPNLIGSLPNVFIAWDYRHDKLELTTKYINEHSRKILTDIKKNSQEFLIDSMNAVHELLSELKKNLKILKKLNNEFLQIGDTKTIKIDDIHPDILCGLFQSEDSISDSNFDDLVDSYQRYLRLYLRISTTLSFGKYENRKKIWGDVPSAGSAIKRMTTGADKQLSKTIDPNEFEQLQRSEFKVFLQSTSKKYYKTPFYKEICEPLVKRYGGIQSLNLSLEKFKLLNIATSHDKSEERKEYLNSNFSPYCELLKLIKIVTGLISDTILNNYIILTLQNGSYEVIYSNCIINNHNFSQYINDGIVSPKHYELFSNEIKKCNYYSWPAISIINSLFRNSNTERIDFSEFNSIAELYGNFFFGQAISNIIFTIKKNNVTCRKIYGCQHLLIK